MARTCLSQQHTGLRDVFLEAYQVLFSAGSPVCLIQARNPGKSGPNMSSNSFHYLSQKLWISNFRSFLPSLDSPRNKCMKAWKMSSIFCELWGAVEKHTTQISRISFFYTKKRMKKKNSRFADLGSSRWLCQTWLKTIWQLGGWERISQIKSTLCPLRCKCLQYFIISVFVTSFTHQRCISGFGKRWKFD